MTEPLAIWTADFADYALLDSGEGEKLERIGQIIARRDEPRAWWKRSLSESAWQSAGARFDSAAGWVLSKDIPSSYSINVDNLKAQIRFTGRSKHIGLFPEQSSQWQWIADRVRVGIKAHRQVSMLNLFGYTGLATLAAAAAGAEVTHVDGSKQAIAWARENQALSALEARPIRWIIDDVLRFVRKEVRQGKRYNAVILDPPSFGRGPKGEVWKLENQLVELLACCQSILSEHPLFIILNLYSTDLSAISLGNMLSDMVTDRDGLIECGELALIQERSDRLLPLSISARWHVDTK